MVERHAGSLRRRAGLRALVAGVLLAAAVPASANTWLDPHALAAERTTATPPAAAGNGAGLSLVGYLAAPSGAVRVLERSGRGAFRLRTLKASSAAPSGDLRLAASPSGRAVATWNDGDAGLVYAWRSPGGTWSAPAALAGGAAAAGPPRLAMLADGHALVAWRTPGGAEVDAALIGTAGAHTPAFTVLSPGLGLTYAGVDAAAVHGDAAFAVAATSADLVLHAAVRRVDLAAAVTAACGATPDLAPLDATGGLGPAFTSPPVVVADRAGGVVLGVGLRSSAGAEALLARCTGAGWQQRAETGASGAARVALAPVAGGRVLAAWTGAGGVVTSERPLLGAGDWSAPRTAASWAALRLPSGADVALAATPEPSGGALVGLVGERPGQQVFASLHRLAAGGLVLDALDARPAGAGSAALAPGVASPVPGGYVAVWRDASGGVARSGDLDVAPPRLTLIGLPGQTLAGRALTLHVSGSDGFSGYVAQTVRWVFGDGSRGSGPRVAHRFVHTGTRLVVVTAKDRAGNVGRVAARVRLVLPAARLVVVRLVRGSLRLRFAAPGGARLTLALRSRRGAVLVRRLPARARTARVPVAALARGRYRVTIAGTYGGVRLRAASAAFRLR